MVQLEKMNQKERKEKPKSTFSKEMRELIDSLDQRQQGSTDQECCGKKIGIF